MRALSVFTARRVVRSAAALLIGVAITAPARAQSLTAPDTFQPWHSVMFRSVISAEVSPDGRQVAFLRTSPRRPLTDDSGPAWVELYLLARDSREVPFVTGRANISNVAWVGDDALVFLDRRADDTRRALYQISTSGGEARKLFEHTGDIGQFDLSRDGRQVAFLATEERSRAHREIEEKGFNQEIFEEGALFTRLFVADLTSGDDPAGRTVRRVEVDGSVLSVEFAPAGDRLLIVTTPTPLVDDSFVAQRVQVVDLDGSVVGRIETAGKIGPLGFSPDGRHVAMVGSVDRNDPAPGRLMVVPAGGGRGRDLLPGLQGHVSTFAWRDAATLAYVADVGVETVVGTVSVDGGNRQTLVAPGDLRVTAIDARASGTALIAEAPRHPPELYTVGGDGSPARQTTSNPWLADLRFARQELIRYKARDGLQLEGVLIYPLDYREGQRYPLQLVVHGGPESHYGNGWLTGYSSPGQVAAARGFAVFHPNYRGSTGRGVEFSKFGQAAATAAEFDDLVDGVDHLVAIGLVDRSRVGITGGSYGGYASAWGATYYSDRFAASIPFVGISDAISKVGTTDIPQEMYDVHHRKWLWEDWDYFAKASPIYYVTRNRTPTLILHGKDDPRVHHSQSMELYRHLKVLGQAPVRLVFYPGEGHGNRRSAARFDYALRTLQWMEHYLVGPGGAPPDPVIDYAKYLPWEGAEGGRGNGAALTVESPSR